MKLENCGRCGLEPTKWSDSNGMFVRCLAHPEQTVGPEHKSVFVTKWNAAQFTARTERINAASLAICAGDGTGSYHSDVTSAAMLIDAQDAAARVRWAEMQKGE